jgi:hypothetical protein
MLGLVGAAGLRGVRRGVVAVGLVVAAATVVLAQDRAERVAAVREQAEQVGAAVEELRGLRFRRPVHKGVQDRQELRSYILAMFAREMPDAQLEDMRRSYVKLGFMAADLDLKRLLIDLYSEQIAGFYDPEKKELFLIDGAAAEEQEMVMAHELVHALQDQHFDLLPLQRSIVENDDRALALTSLIEGDATVSMMDYLLNKQVGLKLDVRNLPDLGKTIRFMNSLGSLLGASQETLNRAPKVLTENLMFGYVDGASFAHRVVKGGGYEAVGGAFWDPPTSSEQILHPEKYLSTPRDEPVAVTLPDLGEVLGDGWRVMLRNVMGELNTRILFAEKLAAGRAGRAAAGWGGDAFQVLEGPAGSAVAVWVWIGDSEGDAEDFAGTYRAFAKARGDGASLHVERSGRRVTIVDGAGDSARGKILAALEDGVSTRRGYETTPGGELFTNVLVPEGWERQEQKDGPVDRIIWSAPGGGARLVSERYDQSKGVRVLTGRRGPQDNVTRSGHHGRGGRFGDKSWISTRWVGEDGAAGGLYMSRGDLSYDLYIEAESADALARTTDALLERNPRIAWWLGVLREHGKPFERGPREAPAPKPEKPRRRLF